MNPFGKCHLGKARTINFVLIVLYKIILSAKSFFHSCFYFICSSGEIGGDDEEEVPQEIISPEVGTVVKLYSVHTK